METGGHYDFSPPSMVDTKTNLKTICIMSNKNNTSAQKIKTTLSDECRQVYVEKNQISLSAGNGAPVGTKYIIISDLEVMKASIDGQERTFNAWRCEGDTEQRRNLLTPRRMAEFSAYAKDADFLKTVQWMDGKDASDAFVLSDDALLAGIDEQFKEITEYLNDNKCQVTLIGKAKNPRFPNTFINIYE